MTSFFSQLQFKGQWRDYQQSVLDELSVHLQDDHLHIVAAPGSGKTVLGLEVMRQLGQPTLILSPTRTIRDQWLERLSWFHDDITWIQAHGSLDLLTPRPVISLTYQALFNLWQGKEKQGFAERCQVLLTALKSARLGTLILDEAHHLRHEWWKALMFVKKELNPLNVVALTATPPYDSGPLEWDRYQTLCGPIDDEIFIPELVKNGDLCPHQDFVHLSTLDPHVTRDVEERRNRISEYIYRLISDETLSRLIHAHPWFRHPELHLDTIIKYHEYYLSILILGQTCGLPLQAEHGQILGLDLEELPAMDLAWLEVFFNHSLHTHADCFPDGDALKSLAREFRRLGCLHRKKVALAEDPALIKALRSSRSKLNSIVEIVQRESLLLKDQLRMVILADHVRKECLPGSEDDPEPINQFGVIPIFECLRRATSVPTSLAVLTGTLVIIPSASVSSLKEVMRLRGFSQDKVSLTPCSFSGEFTHVAWRGSGHAVGCITDLFITGEITVLVGTTALLGEGWDSPQANCLILASTVRSYMLSNQMRGRVIRKDVMDPQKVAHIWHLATLDRGGILQGLNARMKQTGRLTMARAVDLGPDWEALRRRFHCFEGITISDPVRIERGMQRLGFQLNTGDDEEIARANQSMLELMVARDGLRSMWELALLSEDSRPSMRAFLRSTPPVARSRAMQIHIRQLSHRAIRDLLLSTGATGAFLVAVVHDWWLATLVAGGLGLWWVPRAIRNAKLWFRNRHQRRRQVWIALIVIQGLAEAGKLHQKPSKNAVVCEPLPNGDLALRVRLSTRFETNRILSAIQEVLCPQPNPRYVLVHESSRRGKTHPQVIGVPTELGAKKEHAAAFHAHWCKVFGPARLVYTRNPDGRALLLKANARALLAKTQQPTHMDWSWG